MKKLLIITSLVLTCLACVKDKIDLSTSFSEPDDNLRANAKRSADVISKASIDEKYRYKNNHFNTISKALLTVIDEPVFRNQIYAEIEKKFDGDYNVLLETAFPIMDKVNGKSNIQQMKNAKGAELAFKGIEEQDFYPQIHIPFYDKLKAAGKIGKKTPYLILNIGDEKSQKFYSKKLNKTGQLENGVMIDESFSKENEVWVISLNEKIKTENDIQLIKNKSKNLKPTGVDDIYYPKINKVKVKVDYEGWPNGDAEVSGYGYYWNGYASSSYSPTGRTQMNWSRKKMNNHAELPSSGLNTDFTCQWPKLYDTNDNYKPSRLGEYMYYALFEEDAWPVSWKETQIVSPLGTNSVYIDYRSHDTEYWSGVFKYTQIGTFSVNNSNIEFKVDL